MFMTITFDSYVKTGMLFYQVSKSGMTLQTSLVREKMSSVIPYN